MVELVLIVHLGFIVWVVVGGFLALRWWWLALLHLPSTAWAVLLEWHGWICPLTPLENTLRRARGMETYDTGYIEHYLVSIIYPDGLTREIQVLLAVGLLLINGLAYGIFIRKYFSSSEREHDV